MFPTTDRLTPTGRLLLSTIRHWVRAQRARRDLPGEVRQAVEALPQGRGLLDGLEAMMATVRCGTRRRMALANPKVEKLTRDEQCLLSALLAVRYGMDHEARTALAEIQRGTGMRTTMRMMGHLTRVLDRAELDLVEDEERLREPAWSPDQALIA